MFRCPGPGVILKRDYGKGREDSATDLTKSAKKKTGSEVNLDVFFGSNGENALIAPLAFLKSADQRKLQGMRNVNTAPCPKVILECQSSKRSRWQSRFNAPGGFQTRLSQAASQMHSFIRGAWFKERELGQKKIAALSQKQEALRLQLL